MPDLSYRSHSANLEVRGDGRTVVGIAVPFDQPTEIEEDGQRFNEIFRHGAFTKTIRERSSKVKFLALHDHRRFPLGAASLLREDRRGLYGEFHVSATRDGDEALELIRDGALDGLSVGFRPIQDRWNRGRTAVERIEAALYEVSAVAFPAYETAVIAAVRAARPIPRYPASLARARLRLLELKGPRL